MIDASEQLNEIGAALAAAQTELENAAMNSINPHFNSRYADLATILNATRPILAKHGIAIIQRPLEHADRVTWQTILLHKSGQYIAGTYPVPIGKPQGMGSDATYARRYSAAGMTGIAAEEDDDANAAQGKPKSARQSRQEGDYPVFEKALRDTSTLEELKETWDAMQSVIVKWPKGWRDQITEEKDRNKERLQLEAEREALK